MLKSFPPCSLKPHGAGPFRVTVYELVFASMWGNGGNKNYTALSPVARSWSSLVRCGLLCSGPVLAPLVAPLPTSAGRLLLVGEPPGFSSAPAPSSQDKHPGVEVVGGGNGGGGGGGGWVRILCGTSET